MFIVYCKSSTTASPRSANVAVATSTSTTTILAVAVGAMAAVSGEGRAADCLYLVEE